MLTEADRFSIKALTKEAVEEAGGYEACATITRIKRPGTFGDYVNDPRYMVSYDVAIEVDRYLVARGRRPRFGDRFAELIGHVLVAPPTGTEVGLLTQHSSKSAEWFGRLMSDILLSLGDGKLTNEERTRILADVRLLMVELHGVAEAVKASAERDVGP